MGAKGQWKRVEPISKPLHFISTGDVLGKDTLVIYACYLDGPIVCVFAFSTRTYKCI